MHAADAARRSGGLVSKKARTHYVCQACGTQASKWLGRCPGCQAWSTLQEEVSPQAGGSDRAARSDYEKSPAVRLADVEADETDRIKTTIDEFDRVLGGGIVPGSLVLVGGDPGIGKSTLLLQAFGRLASLGHRVLYMTGEESARQVKLRAERLGVGADELYLLAQTRLESLMAACEAMRPRIIVVDSVQTVGSDALDGAHGSVGQIRHVTSRLMRLAKEQEVAVFIVGHVTKEGSIAGPKVMEHMVDTVLYFEGERTGSYRILRAHKNRFGSAQEIGVFEMAVEGLKPVENPSQLFLAQRAKGPGAVVVTQVEGSRPLLLEVQALVTPSFSQGSPRRSSTGYDPQRCAMLCAVLAARTPIDVSGCDVFVNVAGGVRIQEPSADLGVILALASASRGKAIDENTVAIGEVGLSGEIRTASQLPARLAEAEALGFSRALVPMAALGNKSKMRLLGCESVPEALEQLGLWRGRTPFSKRREEPSANNDDASGNVHYD